MAAKRKRHSAEFKAKVALEAIKGVKTLQQLAKDFQVHPTQITIWKKQVSSQVAGLFKRGEAGAGEGAEEELRQANEKIGRLDVELDWLKKKWGLSTEQKRQLIDANHSMLSIQRQCGLVGLSRSAYYYTPAVESHENLQLMRLLDAQYLLTPFYGSRRMTVWLKAQGYPINRKRIQRLMRLMGLEGLAPGPQTSVARPAHPRYPYVLRDVPVVRPNQAWYVDITYVPMVVGFMYLVAIMDLVESLCGELGHLQFLRNRLLLGRVGTGGAPDIFNSDQGVQFTSQAWIDRVEQAGSRVSMDGRGRVFDNIFIERLWRSVKYEDIYVRDYATGPE